MSRFLSRVRFAPAVLILIMLAASACTAGHGRPSSASDGGEPVRGGNLTVQISQDPGSLDPNASGNISTGTLSEYLFDLDAANKPRPVLAESSKVSENGRKFTFALREDVHFSDGTPMRADDVVASLRYWMKYSSYGQPIKKILTRLTATDQHTVQLELSKRWPVPLIIASSAGSAILKASIAKTLDSKGFGRNQVIGTGPYKVKSWTSGEQIVLERNDQYRSPDGKPSGYAGARHAYLDTITFKVVADQDAIASGLETGLWDVATTPVADQYDSLNANSQLSLSTTHGGANDLVFLNNHSGSIMANPKARDALNLAIDKKALMAATGNPALSTDTGAWAAPENHNLYSTVGRPEYEAHDPQRARKLFAEAGYRTGDVIRILTTGEFPQFATWATLIQDQLRKIGVQVKIETYDFSTMISKAKSFDWDLMTLFDDTDVVLPQLSLVVTGLGPFLDVQPVPSDMQKLMDSYTQAGSDADAKRIGEQIQARIWKDKPTIVLGQDKSFIAYTNRLHGYDRFALNFWNSWLTD